MSENPLFEVEQFVSFSEGDPAGIVFFANIFNYAHKTLELFKISQKSWGDWFNDPNVGWPLRHAEAEFFSPIRVGGFIKTLLFLDKQGDKSISFRCMIYQVVEEAGEPSAVPNSITAKEDLGSKTTSGEAPARGNRGIKEVLCATVKTVHVRLVR